VGYLGFLGFVGLLGLFTGNLGFYGFFGFFGLLSSLWGGGSDERVDRNINKACRNTFVFTMLVSTLWIIYLAIVQALQVLPFAFASLFGGNAFLFVGSFVYYDMHGD
jgi:hypothetical protein